MFTIEFIKIIWNLYTPFVLILKLRSFAYLRKLIYIHHLSICYRLLSRYESNCSCHCIVFRENLFYWRDNFECYMIRTFYAFLHSIFHIFQVMDYYMFGSVTEHLHHTIDYIFQLFIKVQTNYTLFQFEHHANTHDFHWLHPPSIRMGFLSFTHFLRWHHIPVSHTVLSAHGIL